MIKRPNAEETEEDLLKQQEEFFKANKSENGPKKVEDVKEAPAQVVGKTFGIIGDIVERHNQQFNLSTPIQLANGFPAVFKVTDDEAGGKNKKPKKQSLFARKFQEKAPLEKSLKIAEPVRLEKKDFVDIEIHQENVTKLKNMTHEEILEEKSKLETTLDPKLLEFLKRRAASKNPGVVKPAATTSAVTKIDAEIDAWEIKDNVRMLVDKEWLEMDKIEPEKLQWIGDIPDVKSLEVDQPYSARFDFNGDLLPFKMDIDVRTSLHHHGDEPDRPGYTIQELYQLSRSTVLQQRNLALNTLANIIRKTKMGYYDKCFDYFLLKKLVESEVFFLLRFSMDDRSVTSAAVNCIHEFFVNRSDEICLDRLLNVAEEDLEPFLWVPFELDNDSEESELKDHQVLSQDIVKGVLRTDLLVRFNYVLREFTLDRLAVGRIFETIIRICRHSVEACVQVVSTPGLVSYVFENAQSREPSPQAVKLLRVLVSSSPEIALSFAKSYSFQFLLKIVEMDEPAFKLKLECLCLWKSLVRNGLFLDEFLSFTPCLTRLLWFYVEKVDSNHGRFDFELFAGIVSVLNSILILKVPIDSNCVVVLQICLVKWMTQLSQGGNVNYSLAKGLGSAFRFFQLKYSREGVCDSDLSFLKKLSPILKRFLQSETFSKASSKLHSFSHIVKFSKVDRDPENLPSLSSIYLSGADYLKIVQDESPLPLFIGLSEFLIKIYEVSHETLDILRLFVDAVKKPLGKVLNSETHSSWFHRYEVKLLALFVVTCEKVEESETLNFAFQCIPHCRSDDSVVLKVIEVILSSKLWSENLMSVYSEALTPNLRDNPRYACESIAKDWILSPITQSPAKTLKFIHSVLEQKPQLLSYISPTIVYYRLTLVFLNENNVFDPEIKPHLDFCFNYILAHFDQLDFNVRVTPDKSFYELYTDLVTQYAATSYGDQLFAKFVTLPLAQKFDVSFRKLLWSEYMHALRVITLPSVLDNFVPLDTFTSPTETDESLLIVYLNAVSKKVLTEARNGYIYNVAVENVIKYLSLPSKDEQLALILRHRIEALTDENLKCVFLGK